MTEEFEQRARYLIRRQVSAEKVYSSIKDESGIIIKSYPDIRELMQSTVKELEPSEQHMQEYFSEKLEVLENQEKRIMELMREISLRKNFEKYSDVLSVVLMIDKTKTIVSHEEWNWLHTIEERQKRLIHELKAPHCKKSDVFKAWSTIK